MTQYYPLRRVPQDVPRLELWRQVRPLFRPLLRSIRASALVKAVPSSSFLKEPLEERARQMGDAAVGQAQSVYFQTPGLDTMTVRLLARAGRTAVRIGRFDARVRIALGRDSDGRLREQLSLLPRTGYDSLMVTGLAVGRALGYFRGGRVHSVIWWDSADPDPGILRPLPPGHPRPAVRRFAAPETLADMAADIDDLYWSEAYGQSLKITRVGRGEARRWLVSLPGTDHGGFESEANAADLEANLREELNMPSAIRVGVVEAIRNAMAADGIASTEMVNERVLVAGHSQGGMVAAALAAADPKRIGFDVQGVLTMGSPTRRLRLRPEVQMVAFEHDQDVVPSLDGTPRREADQRVVIKRKLQQPRRNPLFYAHSSSTYTATVRATEQRHRVAAWGRAGRVLTALQDFLPQPGEETRITHHYTWQELIEPDQGGPGSRIGEEFLRIRPPADWVPVSYEGEIAVPPVEPTVPDRAVSEVPNG